MQSIASKHYYHEQHLIIVDASIGVDSMRQEESTASACSSVLMVYDSKFTQFSSIKFRLPKYSTKMLLFEVK